MSKSKRQVIHRQDNVVLVDFRRDPEPPSPRFPGASGLREMDPERCQVGFAPIAAGVAA